MGKRKYPKVSGYWVYSIKVPSVNKYYIGVSKRKECWQRWDKSKYKGMALEPYLDEWESMEKTVLVDNLTKEEAYKYEDNIIRALSMNGLCINKQRSGLITNDENAYNREWKKNNTEYNERQKQYHKQRYESDVEYREKTKQYKKKWKENNPDYDKQYYENNKEKIKQYRKDNKEKIREYNKQYYERKKLEKQQQTALP